VGKVQQRAGYLKVPRGRCSLVQCLDLSLLLLQLSLPPFHQSFVSPFKFDLRDESWAEEGEWDGTLAPTPATKPKSSASHEHLPYPCTGLSHTLLAGALQHLLKVQELLLKLVGGGLGVSEVQAQRLVDVHRPTGPLSRQGPMHTQAPRTSS
jgi:hypothetical protein